MAQGFSLKDQLFNADKVSYLGGLIAATDPGFNAPQFQAQVMERLPELELKARINHIAAVLDGMLPEDVHQAFDVIERALPPPLDPTLGDDDFGDFILAPLGEVVVTRGLEDHAGRALEVIEAITQRFSMEYAIRPFLNRRPEDTLARMATWARHPNYHVRRLVSEGTRPKLPWGQAIGIDPVRALPLLDQLHADSTRYVTRSVANHLNDIAKIDADAVIGRLKAWAGEGRQDKRELAWMTGHALRTLIKQGEPRALALAGYDPDAPVRLAAFDAPQAVRIGEELAFSVTLEADQPTPVLVDYVLHLKKANGALAPKVFKLKQAKIAPGKPLVLTKRRRMKGDATTFRLFPGVQKLAVQVNGKVLGEVAFELLA